MSRAALALLALLAAPAARGALAEGLCQPSAALSFFGADNRDGRVYFSLDDGSGNLVLLSLPPQNDTAPRLPIAQGAGLFAGSVGSGPLFAWQRCGERCIQALQLAQNGWQALGGPLEIPSETNLTSLYDRGGAPWLVVRHPARDAQWTELAAYRLESGSWSAHGTLMATALGYPSAVVSPRELDSIVSGSARFRASGPATTWVEGLPQLPAEKQGALLPLGPDGASFLAEDGALYTSPDLGANWSGSRWRPWGTEPTTIWRFGSEYEIELPEGTLGDPLSVVWWDRRPGYPERLLLTEVDAQGRWQLRSELPTQVEADTGESVELAQIVRSGNGTWYLVSDCFSPKGSPGLALRSWSEAGLSAPQFVPLGP